MRQIAVADDLAAALETLASERGQSIQALLADFLQQARLTEPKPVETPQVGPKVSFDLLDLLADAVLVLDPNQRIIRFNQGAEEIFGYTASEMIGQSLQQLLPADLVAVHEAHVQEFAVAPYGSRHMAHRQKVFGRRRDGDVFPIRVSILKWVENEREMFVAIMRDVSEYDALVAQEQALSRNLRLLTEYTTDMICLHAADSTYLYANPSCKDITGFAAEELLNTSPFNRFHPDDLPMIHALYKRTLDGEQLQGVLYRYQRKDDVYIWLETSITPVFDEDRRMLHLVTVSRDVTERIRIQEELRSERDLLSRIMETSPSGIAVVNRDGKIIFANKRAELLLGASKDEITERSYNSPTWKHTDYDGNPWPDAQQPFVQVMQTRQPVWDVRHAIQWSDGRMIYLSINGAPLLDENGEINRVVFTVEDYSQRKHQQDELEAALMRERQHNEIQTRFLSLVTHEFRTPLAGILLTTSFIRHQGEKMSSEELQRRLDRIDIQANKLNRMLLDVTFISKDERIGHEIQPEMIDLPNFFTRIIDDIIVMHPHPRTITLHPDAGCTHAMLDLRLMEHVFINLITNAIKYSPPDSLVELRYDCVQGWLTVMVRDHGIGIPPEDQPYIFGEFFRAGNAVKLPGTGLGLAITRRSVEAMGGTITFESTVQVGTEFTVRLPLVPVATATESA